MVGDAQAMTELARERCPRCRRPAALCYCAHLPSLETRARIVILQHPRESRVPIGTARMAHLALPNSELHAGIEFDQHPRVSELRARPGTMLLFPGEGALDPARLPAGALEHLIVIDGTWAQARKVLKLNPALRALPRLGLKPSRPGNYRIRLEPAPECLATIEAISTVLGVLERDPARFETMLAAFTFMVDEQLKHIGLQRQAVERGAALGRARRPRVRRPSDEERLLTQLGRAVFLHAEVNAHPRAHAVPGEPELLHLVAQRWSGERFEAVVAPRRPLATNASNHLGLPEQTLLGGDSIEAARARWADFFRDGDLQCGWGCFGRDQLVAEKLGAGEPLDLRLIVARRLQARPGAPDEALLRLGAQPARSTAPDRASRVIAEMLQLAQWLAARPSRFQPGPP